MNYRLKTAEDAKSWVEAAKASSLRQTRLTVPYLSNGQVKVYNTGMCESYDKDSIDTTLELLLALIEERIR